MLLKLLTCSFFVAHAFSLLNRLVQVFSLLAVLLYSHPKQSLKCKQLYEHASAPHKCYTVIDPRAYNHGDLEVDWSRMCFVLEHHD